MDLTIVDAARAIRPYLHQLLGESGDELDGRLANLLHPVVSPDEESQVRELLQSRPETLEWTATFLEVGEPPEIYVPQERGWGTADAMNTLSPGPRPIAARRFACPDGDLVVYRRNAGEPVPLCHKHKRALEPLDEPL